MKNLKKLQTSIKGTWLLLLAVLAFSGCKTVNTAQPFPSADYPAITEFPSSFLGKFQVKGDDLGDYYGLELGKTYLSLTAIDQGHVVIESYHSFTQEDMENSPMRDKLSIKGDYLTFKNDSLALALKQMEKAFEESPENLSLESVLTDLKNLYDNGRIYKTFPLKREGRNMIYGQQLIAEFDLNEQTVRTYDEGIFQDESEVIIKNKGNRLYLNLPDEGESGDPTYEVYVFELTDKVIRMGGISYDHVEERMPQYEKFMKVTQASQYTLVIDPSEASVEELMKEEGFLKYEMELERLGDAESPGATQSITIVLLCILGVFVLGFLLRRRFSQS